VAAPHKTVRTTCALCDEVRTLKHSHILPEFMYLPLYDGKHRAVSVPAKGTPRVDTIQRGLREYLLCTSCEGRLGEWERNVAPVWKETLLQIRGATPGTVVTLACDYRVLKLFTLSLFWRAGVAAHANFGAVDLGRHEAPIRDLLRAGVPGPVTAYPSLLFGYAGLEHAVGTIGPSGGGIYRDVPMVRLQISGLNWFLAVATNVGTNPYAAVSYRGLTTAISNVPEEDYLRKIANTASL
jgi:hypothetical protein